MSAALWETASRELPSRTSSSFWFLEISTSTPFCMTTLRTSFSPMKLLFPPIVSMYFHPARRAHAARSRLSVQMNPLLGSHVPNLDLKDALGGLAQVDVDGEMSIDVTHLVLEALCDADNQVVDEGADGTEGSDVLADTVVDVDGNNSGLGVGEGDGDVRKVLDKLAAGALDGDLARLDLHLDCLKQNGSVSKSRKSHTKQAHHSHRPARFAEFASPAKVLLFVISW